MNILMKKRIIFNMTYEEYKNSKSNKRKNNIISKILNKLFTIVIFIMIVIILSNYSSKFKNFIIDDVLNSTMDFSKVNKILNNVTSIFKNNKTQNVSSIITTSKTEKYLDGVKYRIGENEKVYVKDSGIVTYIGKKEGYNNTIIVQQSNGYYAWYGNVKEEVKLYDYVEKGSIIGTASHEYYFSLYKDNKKVELNENQY